VRTNEKRENIDQNVLTHQTTKMSHFIHCKLSSHIGLGWSVFRVCSFTLSFGMGACSVSGCVGVRASSTSTPPTRNTVIAAVATVATVTDVTGGPVTIHHLTVTSSTSTKMISSTPSLTLTLSLSQSQQIEAPTKKDGSAPAKAAKAARSDAWDDEIAPTAPIKRSASNGSTGSGGAPGGPGGPKPLKRAISNDSVGFGEDEEGFGDEAGFGDDEGGGWDDVCLLLILSSLPLWLSLPSHHVMCVSPVNIDDNRRSNRGENRKDANWYVAASYSLFMLTLIVKRNIALQILLSVFKKIFKNCD
jgi:hypothetical protein